LTMTSAGGQELQPSEVNNSSTTGRVSAAAVDMNPIDKLEANRTSRKLFPMLSRPAMGGINDIAVRGTGALKALEIVLDATEPSTLKLRITH
jgi:hypothetical protein